MGGVGRGGSCGNGCSRSAQRCGCYELNLICLNLKKIGFEWAVWAAVEAAISGAFAQHREGEL